MTTPRAEFSRIIEVARLPKHGLEVIETASADECRALAARYKLDAVRAFSLNADIMTWRKKGLQIKATVIAKLTQICVVTLEPFEQELTENFEVLMLPEEMLKPDENEDGMEQPEAVIDGQADIGELAAQYLALALDPYPRKTADAFSYIEDDGTGDTQAKISPFAALASLKDKS